MIKGVTVLLFILTVIFNSISICLSQLKKYPAKVTLNEARSSLPHSYELKVEGRCKTWNLKLAPMENIWSDVAQAVSITKDENGTTIFERKSIPKNLKAYQDVKSGSILSIDSNEITGILDSNNSIICENETHFIVELEHKPIEKIDDLLIPNEILPRDYVVRFDEDNNNDTNMTNSETRMSDARCTRCIFTVEVVAIVDDELSNIFGHDYFIYRYLTLFWNEIKVQYQYIKDPKIDIRLIGGVINWWPDDEPFITNNLDENNKISSLKVILDLQKYVYSFSYMLPAHDIIYLQTNREFNDGALGWGTLGGACKIDVYYNMSLSVGIGSDKNGVFYGTMIAAHEIGHLLGADHDDLSKNSCDPNDGYIMGSSHGTRNSYYFSNCSLKNIKSNLYAGSGASCLQTQFTENRIPGKFNFDTLPGEIFDMKYQCIYLSGDYTADVYVTTPEDLLCYNLQCIIKEGIWNTQARSAEGSMCPSGKRCSLGACV